MKKILFLFVALLATMPMQAQIADEGIISITQENTFFLGAKLGGVFTSMSQPKECNLYDGMGFGLSAGVAMKIRFGLATEESAPGTGNWGVGLELKYKQNKVKTIGTDESGKANADFSVNYFEMPIYAQYYPFVASNALNTLYVEAGVSFAGTIGCSPESLTVLDLDGGISGVTYWLDGNGSKLKGKDVRPLLGLGYTLPGTGLDINARYYFSTSELAGNLPSKMNSFEVSVAWLFNVCDF